MVDRPAPSLKPKCWQPCLGWVGWTASTYLGRLPQLPLWHGHPIHAGYPLQRDQCSPCVPRGHVVPCRLWDELEAEQEAFLHLSSPAHSFTSRPGACSGWHKALHELEQPFACTSPQPCPGIPHVPQPPIPHVGGLTLPNKPICWYSSQGLPQSHLCQVLMKGESQRHRFNKSNPELIDILK